MYLHEEKELFKNTIEQAADYCGRTAVVVEKDYYVTRLPQYVKLETALGSYSFPTQLVEIRNYIGDYLEGRGRADIAERFQLERFSMNVQSLERTYIDKLFALCDYYLQGKSKRYSRHLYE